MSGKLETTCELVRRNAAEYPDTPFLNFYDEINSYRDLDQRTNAFANYLLEKGVRRGDVVSYMLGNSPAVFDVLLGAQKIGAIAGPIVEFDLRTFYLRDLTFMGATIVPPGVFADLVGYIERGEIRAGDVVMMPVDGQPLFLRVARLRNFTFGDERYQYYETVCGGSGAGDGFDGTDETPPRSKTKPS